MFRPNRRLLLDTVSVGRFASESTVVDNYSVAIGRKAGQSQMGTYAIAVGELAGEKQQGISAIAIGRKAGQNQMGDNTIAVGELAGETAQGISAIAIGSMAGQTTQATMAIAIGEQAGNENQGKYAIAIGAAAGVKDQPEYSIIISTAESEIVAVKKGLYIDPIRKFDDREDRPATVKEGNILSYNYKNNTPEETKEVVTGFPRLPGYPTDSDVAAAIALTAEDAGTMYFDTTKKKIKVYDGAKWTALADEEDIKKAAAATAAAAAAISRGGVAHAAGSSEDITSVVVGGASVFYNPDGTVASEIYDFYWEPIPGEAGYKPVFYRDLTVVDTVRTTPDGVTPLDRDDRPGRIVTVYDNGHRAQAKIPLEVWNPPAAAWNALPQDERRGILLDYTSLNDIAMMVSNPGGDGDSDYNNTMTGDMFKQYLKSRGLGT